MNMKNKYRSCVVFMTYNQKGNKSMKYCRMYLNFTVICQPSVSVKVLIPLLFKSSKKGQKRRLKAAAKELRELLMETEDQPFKVSSILTTLESGTEMIKKIIQVLENDSDLVQPCCVSSKSPDYVPNINYFRKCQIMNNWLNGSPFSFDYRTDMYMSFK